MWWPKNSAPYYSLNRGASWTPSAPGTPREPNSWQVMWPVADRVNSDKFYIYHVIEGRVYVSTNGGASWAATATPGPDGTLLRAVPGREGHLWLPLQWNGFFRSTDSGLTFQRVNSVQEGYQVGFGRSASGTGYPAVYLWGRVNNVTGLFRSDDEGASWLRHQRRPAPVRLGSTCSPATGASSAACTCRPAVAASSTASRARTAATRR